MIPDTSTLISADATGEILLTHTVVDGMGLCVSVVLLRALSALRRSGETMPGIGPMIWLMLVGELLRAAWLGCLWLSMPAPLLLDLPTFLIGFAVLVGVPIMVSERHLSKQGASSVAPKLWAWLQRAMIATAVVGFIVLLGAISFRLRAAIFLGPAAAYTLTAVFLVSRVSFYRHLQVRRRPLLLFVSFMATGLLALAIVSAFSIVARVRIRESLALVSLNSAALTLILCGIIFLFANVRLADVIVKRALRVIFFTGAGLLAWLAIMHSGGFVAQPGHLDQEVLSLMLVFAMMVLAPAADRWLDAWVDRWVFEQPDLQTAIPKLWGRLVGTEDRAQAFLLTETFLQHLLGLASVRVQPLVADEADTDLRASKPGPRVVAAPPRDRDRSHSSTSILFPLFVDGRADYVLAVSQGLVRPDLTQWEIDFVERIAGRLQVWLGMRSSAERALREASLREEVAGAELRALRAQVNPHFLFNSLNTIADLAVIAPDLAEEMTVRLSSVFRYVLVNTDRHITSLKEELEFARSYLHIEQTRFGDRLKVAFDIDPATLDQQIPTLLLQPLIENALKHGIAPRREGGTLTIRSKREHDWVLLSVADDGVGLQERSTPSERSTRVGIDNVINRLRTAHGDHASFTLQKREPGGTEALMRFPVMGLKG